MGEAKRRREAEAAREAAKPKVALGYVHSDAGRVTSFEDSRESLLGYDREHAGLITTRMAVRCGTDGLPAARNDVAAKVIESDVDWLLWVDTDMGFAPETLYQLLSVAHPDERPIVGALCFIQRQFANDGMFGFRTKPVPTLFDWLPDERGTPQFLSVPMYPVNTVVQVAATGSACILIHRTVFEKIAEKVGPHWYDRTPGADGKLLGEDVSFCVRAAACEIPIHVNTAVRTTHYKAQWLSEVDHWMRYVPPPATERTAVIVPVLGRPEHAEPFMRSLRASTGLATVYAVVERDDPKAVEAWRATGAELLFDDAEFVDETAAKVYDNLRGHGHAEAIAEAERLGVSMRRDASRAAHTFAEKVNLGYRQTTEPWLFAAGSDVKFHAGWLDHAQHVADTLNGHVIGTNDLGNPRVMAGEHATHLLIRRSYIDEVGASWDGPKVVFHEGYRHWFPDDEAVTAAKQRGVWQMALGSVVEHLHPIFGKGADDKVYALGQSFAEQDKALFQQRLEANR